MLLVDKNLLGKLLLALLRGVVMTTQYTTNRLVAVCALVTAGLFALSSCADGTNTLESGDSVRGAAAAASQNASPESAPTSAPSPSAAPASAGAPVNPALNHGAVAWEFPWQALGWQTTDINEPGVLQLANAHGCRFTATQHLFKATMQATDQQETQVQANLWIKTFKKNTVNPISNTEPATDIRRFSGLPGEPNPPVGAQGVPGDPVDMLRVNTDYATPDGATHRSSAWLRVFANERTPVVVTLNYACPSASYSPVDLQELIQATTLANVEHPQMLENPARP